MDILVTTARKTALLETPVLKSQRVCFTVFNISLACTGLRHETVKGRRYLAACAFCQKQKMLRQKSPSGVMCSKAPNQSTEVALEDERCEPGEHPRDTQQLPCLLFRQIVLIWQQDLSRNIPHMHGGRTTVQLQYLQGVARNVQIWSVPLPSCRRNKASGLAADLCSLPLPVSLHEHDRHGCLLAAGAFLRLYLCC